MGTAVRVLAGAASVILLAGCVAQIPEPQRPSDADARTQVQTMLDATRLRYEIAGAPLEAAAIRPKSYERWDAEMRSCLIDAGVDDVGAIVWSGDGFELYLNSGSDPDYDESVAMYRCVADDPPDGREFGALYSDEQRDYLWNYYKRWVVPCIIGEQYELQLVPTRNEFLASSSYLWSPYDSVVYPRSETADVVDGSWFGKLVERCGPRYGLIEQ